MGLPMLATYHHSEFSAEAALEAKSETVSVCIPARDTGALAGRTVERVMELVELGLVEEVLVIDGSEGAETGEAARAAGAEVVREEELLPDAGPALGKGDAMWRGLSRCTGELVCFVDSDLYDFEAAHVVALLAPLFRDEAIAFTKATYERPLIVGGRELRGEGGRVTELTARPLLELFFPDAAAFRQPLAGECAGRRWAFERIPFCTGYGVEIAMIVDLVALLGLERMAQVDLGVRRNPNQSLRNLSEMARDVAAALLARVEGMPVDAAERAGARLVERPPLAEWAARSGVDSSAAL
jgi:glucosyl-3-phosphoglycerate synthase